MKNWSHPILPALISFLAACPFQLTAAEMAFQILHEFGLGSGPRFPYGPLIEGEDGSFYGASRSGGIGAGTIYKITPQGTPTVLYSFDGSIHYDPWNLVQTAHGDLYGLARAVLPFGPGTTLFRFRTNDSSFSLIASYPSEPPIGCPAGLLTSDGGANLYNVHGYGGENGLGQAFRINTNGNLDPLFTFSGTNGSNPIGRLLLAQDGSLYGATAGGGAGHGTIFRFTTNGGITTVAEFGLTNGSTPWSFLNWGRDGQIYGTTLSGGVNGGSGTAFRISTNGHLVTMATFHGTNGSRPISGVFHGPNGKLYGLTTRGFEYTVTPGEVGSVFSLTTNGLLTTIAKFNGTNALNPIAEFTMARDGNLYAVTTDEGLRTSLNGNSGLFFRLAQVPEITATILTNDVAWLQWTSFTNGVYRVEAKNTVTNASWMPLSSNLTATGNNLSFTSPTMGISQRYYRVVLVP